MPVRRLLATFAVPLLLVGALAACSSEPDVKVEPKLPTPSATSPTATEAAQESPEAFIRRWVAEGDRMQRTGETATYAAMSLGCEACKGFMDAVADVHKEGGSVDFAGTAVVRIDQVAASPPSFDVLERVPKTRIRRGDGTETTMPAGTTTLRVVLKKGQRTWTVRYFGIVPS